ncbi:MAG: hypothetical protein Q9170_001168 [Blastenia crenularia]
MVRLIKKPAVTIAFRHRELPTCSSMDLFVGLRFPICRADERTFQTGVVINQYAANFSHGNFSSPFTFAPSRWLGDPQYADYKFDAVQPFSIGTRNFIGKK